MTHVTKADLPNLTGLRSAPIPFLYCPLCGTETSADRGDYFLLPDEHVFKCCGKPMRLVVDRGGAA